MYLAPVLLVVIPILAALVTFIFKNKISSYIVFVSQTALIVIFILYVRALQTSPEFSLVLFGGWDEQIAISFFNDRLSLIFIGLTIFIMTIILTYAFTYHQKENLFFFFVMFIQGIFIGALQSNDLFNLFVFIELITLLTAILIAFKKKSTAFRASIYYLLYSSFGAMLFLIGIIFIYYIYGTLNIQILTENISLHSNEGLVKFAFVLMITGISIKTALFPVFLWLPKAHTEAHSSISALLSGLIVKIGLYIFIRVYLQMFSGAGYNMSEIFFYLGAITAIMGIILAVSQNDIKMILAYSTISQIGIILMGLVSSSNLSYVGGLMHVINHALFKSLLFLGAGIVIKQYQTRNIHEIRGVFKSMPWTAFMLIIGMLSIAGAPLFNGFVSKCLIGFGFSDNLIKSVLYSIICIGTVTIFLKFSQILFGPKQNISRRKDYLQLMSMTIVGVACLAIGIFYVPFVEYVLNQNLYMVSVFNVTNIGKFILYIFIGMILYRFVIEKDIKSFVFLRENTLTFENANYLTVIYISFLLAVMFLRGSF